MQVDSEDIRHRVIQFHRFLLSAKTLMQLLRLVLQPLLHSRLTFFFLFFFVRVAKVKTKLSQEERKVHTVLFAPLVRAGGEQKRTQAVLRLGPNPQLELGRH